MAAPGIRTDKISENVMTTNAKKLRKNFKSEKTPFSICTRKLKPSKILKK